MHFRTFDRILCRFASVGLLALGASAWSSAHAQSCNCEATPAQERAADVLLTLTPAQRMTSALTHLPFGVPTTAGASNTTVRSSR